MRHSVKILRREQQSLIKEEARINSICEKRPNQNNYDALKKINELYLELDEDIEKLAGNGNNIS